MKVVILAAGKGTRMGALTAEIPKPLLEIQGKTLLEHKFDNLPPSVEEIIIIIGYQGNKIKERFGNFYKGFPIKYVIQEELNGTGGALWCARPFLNDRFLVMMGDDIYSKEDIGRSIATTDWAMLVSRVEGAGAGGKVVTINGVVTEIVEGTHEGVRMVNTNMLTLDARIFDEPLVPKSEGSNEYGLPQTVLIASKKMDIPLHPIETNSWIQVTSPEDLHTIL